MAIVAPVSYTHLDVYKRQEIDDADIRNLEIIELGERGSLR